MKHLKIYLNPYVILYLISGIMATLVTIWFKPLDLGLIAIPPSSWVMGFTFLYITIIADRLGNKIAGNMIWILLILTSFICFLMDYSQGIVFASGIAFLVGQLSTKALYNLTKHSLASSMIGSFIDAVIWILLGLSPIGIGSVPWSMFINAVIGQVVIQFLMQYLANKIYSTFYQK